MRAWRVADARFEAVNLANVDASGARFVRVAAERCRATGLNVSEASLRDAIFVDCRCDMLAAFGASFTRCWFQACDLEEADFDGATFDRVVFRDCNLRGARLARIDLRKTDLRGSRLDGLVVSPERLAGLTIEPAQADVFAAALGLRMAPAPAAEAP
jgi:uncharacterized protein YjbI with pentapeptide repeats